MMRRDLTAFGLFAVLVAGAGAAQSEDQGTGFGRTIELPAHRALMAMRAQETATLAPFETDGCSGGMSEVWRLVAAQFPDFSEVHDQAPPWESCCVVHDRVYHNGGAALTAEHSFTARLAADQALEACVVEVGEARNADIAATYGVTPNQVTDAYATIAGAMFLAVRFGGAPCSGLPWRWGFGYPACSVFQATPD